MKSYTLCKTGPYGTLTQHKQNGISSHIAKCHWDPANDIGNRRWAPYLYSFAQYIQDHREDKGRPTTKSVWLAGP